MTDIPQIPAETQAVAIEAFRRALMIERHDDWSMETVAEAAHICARALRVLHSEGHIIFRSELEQVGWAKPALDWSVKWFLHADDGAGGMAEIGYEPVFRLCSETEVRKKVPKPRRPGIHESEGFRIRSQTETQL